VAGHAALRGRCPALGFQSGTQLGKALSAQMVVSEADGIRAALPSQIPALAP
jgi:hypothetical protein